MHLFAIASITVFGVACVCVCVFPSRLLVQLKDYPCLGTTFVKGTKIYSKQGLYVGRGRHFLLNKIYDAYKINVATKIEKKIYMAIILV